MLLGEQGQVEELRTEVDAGTSDAGVRLADLLIARAQTEKGRRMKRFGLNPGGSIASPPDPTT
ncbi:MAG: hypothetical protein M3256_18045 [Actinomycetota bacterium]|nr:hypothetical protein [Actinomycetota bacterium]